MRWWLILGLLAGCDDGHPSGTLVDGFVGAALDGSAADASPVDALDASPQDAAPDAARPPVQRATLAHAFPPRAPNLVATYHRGEIMMWQKLRPLAWTGMAAAALAASGVAWADRGGPGREPDDRPLLRLARSVEVVVATESDDRSAPHLARQVGDLAHDAEHSKAVLSPLGVGDAV